MFVCPTIVRRSCPRSIKSLGRVGRFRELHRLQTSSEQWSGRKAVQAVKRLMKKAKKDRADVYLALMD